MVVSVFVRVKYSCVSNLVRDSANNPNHGVGLSLELVKDLKNPAMEFVHFHSRIRAYVNRYQSYQEAYVEAIHVVDKLRRSHMKRLQNWEFK